MWWEINCHGATNAERFEISLEKILQSGLEILNLPGPALPDFLIWKLFFLDFLPCHCLQIFGNLEIVVSVCTNDLSNDLYIVIEATCTLLV